MNKNAFLHFVPTVLVLCPFRLNRLRIRPYFTIYSAVESTLNSFIVSYRITMCISKIPTKVTKYELSTAFQYVVNESHLGHVTDRQTDMEISQTRSMYSTTCRIFLV